MRRNDMAVSRTKINTMSGGEGDVKCVVLKTISAHKLKRAFTHALISAAREIDLQPFMFL